MENKKLTHAEQIETPKFKELKKEFHEKYPDLKSFNLAEYLKDFDMKAEMSLPLLEYIFSLDINFNATTKKGASALMYSIKAQFPIEVIKTLIENGADVNACVESGASTLMFAVVFKSPTEIVKLLIDNGVNVNAINEYGNTPLMNTITHKSSIEIIKLLVENGADVNAANQYGTTPLMSAIGHQSQIEIIEWLIENGADVNAYSKDNASVLIGAIISHTPIEIIKLLVENGADINTDTEKNLPVLAFAIQHQTSIEIIKLLIENGADVNVVFNNGMTLLMFAIIFEQREEVVEILVNNGADVNAVFTENSISVLTYAIMLETPEKFVKLLIDSGANVNAVAEGGISILTYAIMFQSPIEIIKLLVKNDADVNAVLMENSISVLMFAVMIATTEEIVEFLIDSGADVNYDGPNASSLTIAILYQSSQEMIELLEKYDTHIPSEKTHMLEEILFEIFEEDYLDDMNVKYRDVIKNITTTKNKMKTEFSKIDIIDIKSMYEIFSDFTKNMNLKLRELFDSIQINMPTPTEALQSSLPYGIDINRTMDGETLFSIGVKKQDKELIKLLIDNGVDVNVTLDNGKSALEFAEFIGDKQLIDMIKDASTFQKNEHNPKQLVKLLSNFTIDKPMKYTTHEWESKNEYKNFNEFINAVKHQWEDIKTDLESLSPNLYKKIYTFILDKNPSENYSWCSQTDINIGWSSIDGLKQWCDEGKNPFKYPLKNMPRINDKTINTFGKVIDLFKQEIEMRDDFNTLLGIMKYMKKEFRETLRIDYDANQLNKQFYTDTQSIKEALKRMLKQMEKRAEHNEGCNHVEISLGYPDGSYYELKIIHNNSFSPLNPKELSDEVKSGDFKEIKNKLTNLCDWSVENRTHRINYLKSNNIKDVEELDTQVEGFTHILRFYK